MNSLYRHIALFVVMAFAEGCASSEVLITTVPENAKVYSLSKELMGMTPLKLSTDQLSKLQKESNSPSEVMIAVRKEGFESIEVFVEPKAFDTISLRMLPLGQETFKNQIAKEYYKDFDSLISRFLKAQGYLSSGQISQASELVKSILADYPDLASAHVLASDLAFVGGNKQLAREHIIKAASLSPEDADIKRSLNKLGAKR